MMKKLNKMVKNIDVFDISLIKISVAAAILLLVKYVPELASLEWYWYAIIFVAVIIRPMKHMFCKKK